MIQQIGLFPAQRAALAAQGRELLLEAEPRAGATHLLRVMAYLNATTRERQRVVIASKEPENRLRELYWEGEHGLWELFRPLRERKEAESAPGVVRLKNGSSVQVVPWEAAARRDPHTLLIDDADSLGYGPFERMRDRVLASPAAAGDVSPRIIAVSKQPGWAQQHWSHLGESGARAALAASQIPAALRAQVLISVPKLSVRQYVDLTRPGFIWHRHCCVIAETLQLVIERQILRLLIQAPPRYGKSELVARSLPGCELLRRQDSHVGLASAGSKLAISMSKDARARYREAGGRFMEDSKDASLWRTPAGGEMWAKGVGTAILGFGFDLGIIDDPFRSRIEACSPTIQEKVFEWYWGDFFTRRQLMNPELPAAIVIMHQRLDQADLAGRILEREQTSPAPQDWTILNLPAIKRKRSYHFPQSCHILEDERFEGEALCPAMQTEQELKQLEAADSIIFSAVYQQDPLPSVGGGMFERHYWPLIGDPDSIEELLRVGTSLNEVIADQQEAGEVPRFIREVRAWDYAGTKLRKGEEARQAATVGTRGGITAARDGVGGNPLVVFTDQIQEFVEDGAVEQLILRTARADGRGVEVVIPQDPGPAGKILARAWQNALQAEGFKVIPHLMSGHGSKRARALPHAGAARPPEGASAGRCRMMRGPWNDPFAEQHHQFNGVSGQMDRVDSASDCFNELEVSSDALPPAQVW